MEILVMTIYCSSDEYDGLMKVLKKTGAIVKEDDSDMAAIKEWADALSEDTDQKESLYDQISKYNHGIVDNSTDLVE